MINNMMRCIAQADALTFVSQRDAAVIHNDKLQSEINQLQQSLQSQTQQCEDLGSKLESSQGALRAESAGRQVALDDCVLLAQQLKAHEQVVSQTEGLLAEQLQAERQRADALSGMTMLHCCSHTSRLASVPIFVSVCFRRNC